MFQAVLEKKDMNCQVGEPKPFSKAVQYSPRVLEEVKVQEILHQPSLKEFLDKVYPRSGWLYMDVIIVVDGNDIEYSRITIDLDYHRNVN